jgi:hypothetical protein
MTNRNTLEVIGGRKIRLKQGKGRANMRYSKPPRNPSLKDNLDTRLHLTFEERDDTKYCRLGFHNGVVLSEIRGGVGWVKEGRRRSTTNLISVPVVGVDMSM